MADYTRPDVYVNEASGVAAPIQAASTAVAGFVGVTARGIPGVALVLTSWQDFVNKFARGLSSAYLSTAYATYSVYGFFGNGGASGYFVRPKVTGQTAASFTYKDSATTPNNVLTFTAAALDDSNASQNDPGVWGNGLTTNLVANAKNASNYDVVVKLNGTQVESYTNCSLLSTSSNYIDNLINGVSNYVSVSVSTTGAIAAGSLGVDQALAGGTDAAPADSDFTAAFDAFDSLSDSPTLLVSPDSNSSTVVQYMYGKAQTYNAFAVIDCALADTPSTVQTTRANYSTKYADIYFPWISINDPLTNKPKFIPPSGHILGAYARTDAGRGAFKAPAGTVDGKLKGAIGLSYKCNPTEIGTLNADNINIIRSLKNVGIVLWGARTLDTTEMYINIRREKSKIERSIKEGTLWAVFEPNDDTLWRKLTTASRAFLFKEFEAGAFAGVKPDGSDSFYVTCNATNNTAGNPQVNTEIGVALVDPGEFIVFTVSQQTAGSF